MPTTAEQVSLETLFEQLRADLKTEAEAIANGPWLSVPERHHRYLRHVKSYDAARLSLQKPAFESADQAGARAQIYQLIEEILDEVGSARSLSLVAMPSRAVATLPITVDGAIAEPEFPDRPSSADLEGLTEWNRQINAYAPIYALQYEITEPIQRSHGLFESAMPQDSLDRLIFRTPADQQWMRETRRNNLVIRAEILIRNYSAELPQIVATISAVTPPTLNSQAPLGESAAASSVEVTGSTAGEINSAEERSRWRRAKIDPLLTLLGWSRYDWATATAAYNNGHAVAYTTISRYLDGITGKLRATPERLLRISLQEALSKLPDPCAALLAEELGKALPA